MAGEYFYKLPNYQHWSRGVLYYTPQVGSTNAPWPGSLGNWNINGGQTYQTAQYEDGIMATSMDGGTTLNSVVVGMVETEQSELFYGNEESIAAISKNVPLGRLAKPADVGWAAAFLASDAASYISGASLEVHGGGEPPHYLTTTNANAIK